MTITTVDVNGNHFKTDALEVFQMILTTLKMLQLGDISVEDSAGAKKQVNMERLYRDFLYRVIN